MENISLVAAVITILLGVPVLWRAAIRIMNSLVSKRGASQGGVKPDEVAAAATREAEGQNKLTAARQRGYEELKILAFGLTVGIALMWAAKR
jgi:hypothetical protein